MLYYDRNDVSKRVDINKASESNECDICHYLSFLNNSFKFQPNVCNKYNDLLMTSISNNYIAI